jgi:hypothetical protein
MPWWMIMSGGLCALLSGSMTWAGRWKPSQFWEGLLWLTIGAGQVFDAVVAYAK